MAAKDAGINGFGDLKGKTVVTTAGTASERLLKEYNNEKLRHEHHFCQRPRRSRADAV